MLQPSPTYQLEDYILLAIATGSTLGCLVMAVMCWFSPPADKIMAEYKRHSFKD